MTTTTSTTLRSAIVIACATLGTLAPVGGARAQTGDEQSRAISGETTAGRGYTGTVTFIGSGASRLALARVRLDFETRELVLTARVGAMPDPVFTVEEREATGGARGALLEEDPAGSRYRLIARPAAARRFEANLANALERAADAPRAAADGEEPAPVEALSAARGERWGIEIVREDGTAFGEADDPARDYLVGERVALRVRLVATEEGADVPAASDVTRVRWTIAGTAIKDYRHDLVGSPFEHVVEHEATPLSASDLDVAGPEGLSFFVYYTRSLADAEIRVSVEAAGETRDNEETIHVARDENPARSIYTLADAIPSNFVLLPTHADWHANFNGTDRFVLFHRNLLAAYNAWRVTFGYLPVESVASADEEGGGLEPPSYLTEEGGTERSARWNATRLTDFETLSQLGDDLESPWHNQGHVVESRRVIDGDTPNSDMISVMRAPQCEVFYMWHTKIDEKAREWAFLKENEGPREVEIVTVARGDDSRITAPRNVEVRDARAWAELWRAHTGSDDAAPFVDFTREIVVGRIMGAERNGTVDVTGAVEEDGDLTVSVTEVLLPEEDDGGDDDDDGGDDGGDDGDDGNDAEPIVVTENADAPINDLQTTTSTLEVTEDVTIASARLFVDIEHTYIGDLLVTLTAPDGTEVVLHDRAGRGNDDIVGEYPTDLSPEQSLDALAGRSGRGTWTLSVNDDARQDQGTLRSWRLTLVPEGETPPPPPPPPPPGGGGDFTSDEVLPIDDNQTITSVIEVNEDITVADLRLALQIQHTYRGDLTVSLTSPAGTRVVLHDRAGRSADDIVGEYPTSLDPAESLARFDGESARGRWTLAVQDSAGGDTGELRGWTLRLGEAEQTPTSSFHFVRALTRPEGAVRFDVRTEDRRLLIDPAIFPRPGDDVTAGPGQR